jgi:hypothetical protein
MGMSYIITNQCRNDIAMDLSVGFTLVLAVFKACIEHGSEFDRRLVQRSNS